MNTRRIMKTLRPRLITFDITGTLLGVKLVEHYLEVSSQYGVTLTNSQLLAPSFKHHYKNLCKEHPVFGKYTGMSSENWWTTIVHNVFQDLDSQISGKTLNKIAAKLISDYSTDKCWYKFPGAVDILQYLNEKKFIVGVISNFDDRLEPLLISVGLRKHFDFVLTSYHHGNEKPHISIFEAALKLARDKYGSRIHPQEALHVGDNLLLDYHGAKNAGWNAFIIEHDSDKSNDQLKDVSNSEIFQSLDELKDYLQATN